MSRADLPFLELCDTFLQVSSCFESGVLDAEDVDLGQSVREQGAKVGREVVEGVIAAFEAVHEDEEKRLLHCDCYEA